MEFVLSGKQRKRCLESFPRGHLESANGTGHGANLLCLGQVMASHLPRASMPEYRDKSGLECLYAPICKSSHTGVTRLRSLFRAKPSLEHDRELLGGHTAVKQWGVKRARFKACRFKQSMYAAGSHCKSHTTATLFVHNALHMRKELRRQCLALLR